MYDCSTQHASFAYKFTGKERDSESGLDNFGARYNASSLGRFMSPDPLMASAHVGDPQSWNRYTYALNNPLRFIDPDGMAACGDKDKCVDVKVNVIYDQNANKGKGLTDRQKSQIQKQILSKAQDQFGTSKIKLDLNFTAGKISVDSQGNASFTGLQKGALNLLFTDNAPYAATQGDAGATSKAGGMYLSVVDVGHAEFDEETTVSHELAHQFLGDPDRTPNKDALTDSLLHIYREGDIAVRNFFQRQGVSQTDYREGAKKFSPPQTQENITPKQ
jgi:RHS repeat-associated protein